MASSRVATAPIDVLIVDADPAQRRVLAGLIAERTLGRFAPRICDGPYDALAAVRAGSITIADIETVGGPKRLAELAGSHGPLIATSQRPSLTAAVAAVRAGAVDFLAKPIGANQLFQKLEAAISSWRETNAVQAAGRSPGAPEPTTAPERDFAGFIGKSPAMRAVYEQIRRVAPSRAPVFITGESGTGKELCAEAVHTEAGIPDRPFVALNCSAIPKELMESEIFGHVRGAFTGATENRTGAAELAHGGTLFLDEICEMDIALQAKLLRFLQCGTLRPVGGSEARPVDVRIVCATNRDPSLEVEAGRFRADLFYRLHVLPIHLPPLRERRPDIPALATAFLARYSSEERRGFTEFDNDAAAMLAAAPWPGNVRELQNTVRRVVVLNEGGVVAGEMLSGLHTRSAGEPVAIPLPVLPFWKQEQLIIETALAAQGGNIGKAAHMLEISPSTIYRKREAWGRRFRG
jgi:two-component system repressor protein LuxO